MNGIPKENRTDCMNINGINLHFNDISLLISIKLHFLLNHKYFFSKTAINVQFKIQVLQNMEDKRTSELPARGN